MQLPSEKQLPWRHPGQNMQRIFQAYEDLRDERNSSLENVLLLTIAMLEEDEKPAATVRKPVPPFCGGRVPGREPRCSSVCWMRGWAAATMLRGGDASQTIYFTGATLSRYLLILRAGTVARTR